MPSPSRAETGARLSRRAALVGVAAAAGAAVVGCTSDRPRRRGESEPAPVEPSVDPDVEVAAEALADQRAMIDLLDATRSRHRRLSALLAPVVAAHEAHAAMLSEAVPDDVSVPPSTSPAPTPDGSSPRRATVPRAPGRALDQVVAAEQALATATKRHAFRAQSGAFARLLGSMGAASAQYTRVLASTPAPKGAS